VDLLVSRMAAEGIDVVANHGNISPGRRNRDLYDRFVDGEAPGLASTMKCGGRGLNLYMADRILFLDRFWNATAEDQAMARALRPQQTKPVLVEYLHLQGSIDVYKAQMVANKASAAALAIDQEDDGMSHDEYQHLETILGRFRQDLAKFLSVDQRDLREELTRMAYRGEHLVSSTSQVA
jgi:SNF2 family DNA or RNA helicase